MTAELRSRTPGPRGSSRRRHRRRDPARIPGTAREAPGPSSSRPATVAASVQGAPRYKPRAASNALKEIVADALEALLPLAKSAIDGIEKRGLTRGLTGPIARGDISVVQMHLNALPKELATIYRALSLQALALVGDQLPIETHHALKRLLAF